MHLITQGLWWRRKMRLMLFFVPTNATSILKRMDHMIILTFKCCYWSNTFPKVIAAIDCDCSKAKSIKNFGKAFTILSSVQLSRSVVSDSLRQHGLQHIRPPCPSPTPKVYSSSCPLSWWCHPTISSSVVPFSSRPQSFPESGSFQMSNSLHKVAKVLEFQLQH